ncbi:MULTISPECIES: hypothetical protein [unclassified Solwaraspora]|uniref:hypothetical protein n=1 Tax=unclassified Solwaraspora TaxID=2627926 RepID=UPI00248D10B8|nr:MULTISPECIES: hypothetical protein [unclassified Solwaraspora]WBB97705.1 hypothetical protein O7553_01595 [Solwaraspora sp. WMMA2059]WBC18404.1 hypothetical protein O7543_15745 [Solwaraspora sp. WMMA2080]WJK34181.1 hypothetical protein O7610_26760 [Solwaraspora sp. WMMA2065]
MIAVLLATVAVGALSAVSPVTPIEPYLIALTATTSSPPVALGVAAALGQTVAKLAMFLASRGVIQSPWLRRWLAKRTAPKAAATASAVAADGTTPTDTTATNPTPTDDTATDTPPTDGRPRAGWLRRIGPAIGDRLPQGLRSRLSGWAGWVAREHRRLYEPAFVIPTLFASSVIGVPPLLVTTVVAGGTRMPASVFAVVCFIGRSIRFVALAMVPSWFSG